MSEPESQTGDPEDTVPPTVEEGRYVYCVVRAGGGATVDATGVEDERVRVVTADGIGAVVHDCEAIYDSADPTEIRRWLVGHQRVVDAAGDRFGTPLPFQFDTVVRGGDDAVRDWLREERTTLSTALDELADHWEYRIEVVRTDPVDEEAVLAADDRLAELRTTIEEADRGRAHLLEKRYDARLEELLRERRNAFATDVRERVAPHVREVHELEREPSVSVASAGESATDAGSDDPGGSDTADPAENDAGDPGPNETAGSGGGETICRLVVLAHEDDEGSLGDVLDDVATANGVEVRFTGPWPPYTFAPSFGGDDREAR